MNKSQADDFINLLSDFVDTCINARNTRDAVRQETRRQYADMLKTTLVKYTNEPIESCTCRAIDIPAADTAREIRPTSSTHWQTKDCAMLNTDKFYALWYCDGITGEILRVNGRVTWEGRLAEIADLDAATIDIGELYFWQVNCLKDQLAAQGDQSTSTVVEVDSRHEYTDNAEIETETVIEYD